MHSTPHTTDGSRRSPLRRRSATVALAVAGAVVLWAVATQLAGIDVRSPEMGDRPPADITLARVVATTLVASAAAWGLLAVLERRTRHAHGIWLGTTLAALLASLGAPLSGDGITTANQAVLVLLHLAVGAVVLVGLPRAPSPAASSTAGEGDRQGALR